MAKIGEAHLEFQMRLGSLDMRSSGYFAYFGDFEDAMREPAG